MSRSVPELNHTKGIQGASCLTFVQNSLRMSYLVNWILAGFKDHKLISSIFCFHIDPKHWPSGSYLCPAICHVTWTPCLRMLTNLENLRAHSGLAFGIDVVGKVRRSQEKSTYNTRWSQSKLFVFLSAWEKVDLPQGNLVSFRVE